MIKLKNILFVVPRMNIGGAETYVATVAIKLKEAGFNVFVASGGGMLADEIQKNGIRHFFLPIRLSVDISAYFLAKIIKRNKIELIHANSAAAGITAVLVKKNYIKIPVVYTAHGAIGHRKREMLLNECDKIICVSEFLRQDAIEKGFHAEKLVTLYNGIDIDKFQPNLANKEILRGKYDIPIDAFTPAIISRIKNLNDKGHEDVLQVLKNYEGAKDWHLLVIGKGKALTKLKVRLKEDHLEARVHCIGHVIEVQHVLDAADAVVLPSKFETFGLVLAEGMAMEKAAVAYAVGGIPEVIADGQTGYLAEAGDIDDLYKKLAILANDKLRCRALGKCGRQRVVTEFSCAQMLTLLIKIYNQVYDNHRINDDEK